MENGLGKESREGFTSTKMARKNLQNRKVFDGEPMAFEKLDQDGCGLRYQKGTCTLARSLSLSLLSHTWMLDFIPVFHSYRGL